MKLFVWNDPYGVSYGFSLLIVVAPDVESAKRFAATEGKWFAYGNERLPYDHAQAVVDRLKDPDRIMDIPCAEFHEWSE
jgi:hypothetical protein